MLREMAAWLEAVTVETPLVLVLEDLHWSDYATLDLVAWLARRQEPARLLLVGTYRPVEVLARGHPLRGVHQALQLHGHCAEVLLAFLSEASVAEYLTRRCPGYQAPAALVRRIHQRTDGNPLFMVHVVEELLTQGRSAAPPGCWVLHTTPEADIGRVPEGIRQMLALQLDRLPLADQRLLEAASVAGAAFAAASVAAGVTGDVVTTEEHCERLAQRQQFLRPAGTVTWPDGTITGRYEFIHALYQNVVYHQMAAARRVRLHQRIGARLEAAYGADAGDMAAELAMHFAQGRDAPRAIPYLQQAGENALRRSAHHTAITHLTTAVQLLETLPETPERTQRALALYLALGTSLMAAHGFAAPETGTAFRRAHALSQQVGDPEQAFAAVRGLSLFHTLRGELRPARALGEQLLRQTHRSQPALRLEAHRLLGATLLWQGVVIEARGHFEQSLALYEPQHRVYTFLYGVDSGVASGIFLAMALWVLGYPEQASQQSQAALTLAQELAHPMSLASARTFTAMLHQWARESALTQHWTETTIALATEHGFPQWLQTNTSLLGWALARQGQVAEGLSRMRQSFDTWRAIGAGLYQPYLLALLAEAHAMGGRMDEGLHLLDDAFAAVHHSGEGLYEAELYRLHGELLLAHASTPSTLERAEGSLQQALAIARQQQAKSWELRAALRLSRLWQHQGKREAARALLAPVHGWFTEGFDTADMLEAKTLLADLS
jgi:adenylate cyclase